MNQKYHRIRIVSIILVAVLFFGSIFLIYATRNDLWNSWFSVEALELDSEQIIGESTEWEYMDNNQEPGVGNVWTTLDYESEPWKKTKGIFQKNLSKYNSSSTSFFRHEFIIDDINKYKHIEGNIKYADAVIVYLNGAIVFTGNVPSGGYYSNQDMGASNPVDSIRESTFYITDLTDLREGKNVIAVEVHRKDLDSTNMYFHFSYLKLYQIEKEEIPPNTEELTLLKASDWDKIEVSWVTDSDKPYRIEYMEGKKDKVKESTFSKQANSIIMGSTRMKNHGMYVNSAVLTRLKEETDYVYRVIQIGGEKGSQFYEFHTSKKQETSFLIPGIIKIGEVIEGSLDASTWEDSLNRSVSLIEKIDYIIYNEESLLRSAEELKEIPIILTESNQGLNSGIWTFLDSILISIDSEDKDYKSNIDFLGQTIKEKNRNWTIVFLDTSKFDENDETIRAFEEAFRKLDVDIIVDRGNKFSAYYTNSDNLEKVEKSIGQTIYLSMDVFSEDVVNIKVKSQDILIERYDIEERKKVDSLCLLKGK